MAIRLPEPVLRGATSKRPSRHMLIGTVISKMHALDGGDPEPSDGELCQVLRNVEYILRPRGFKLDWRGPGGIKEGTIYEVARLEKEKEEAGAETEKAAEKETKREVQQALW